MVQETMIPRSHWLPLINSGSGVMILVPARSGGNGEVKNVASPRLVRPDRHQPVTPMLDLSGLGHNGFVHDAREASGQLNECQLQVQSEGWHWVALGRS